MREPAQTQRSDVSPGAQRLAGVNSRSEFRLGVIDAGIAQLVGWRIAKGLLSASKSTAQGRR